VVAVSLVLKSVGGVPLEGIVEHQPL
jgi:hypothetical protein